MTRQLCLSRRNKTQIKSGQPLMEKGLSMGCGVEFSTTSIVECTLGRGTFYNPSIQSTTKFKTTLSIGCNAGTFYSPCQSQAKNEITCTVHSRGGGTFHSPSIESRYQINLEFKSAGTFYRLSVSSQRMQITSHQAPFYPTSSLNKNRLGPLISASILLNDSSRSLSRKK